MEGINMYKQLEYAHALELQCINNTLHYIQYATFITLFMKLVKGCKVCREQFLKNTSPSSEPSSMLLLELTKPV